jgi:hypothetical protein
LYAVSIPSFDLETRLFIPSLAQQLAAFLSWSNHHLERPCPEDSGLCGIRTRLELARLFTLLFIGCPLHCCAKSVLANQKIEVGHLLGLVSGYLGPHALPDLVAKSILYQKSIWRHRANGFGSAV